MTPDDIRPQSPPQNLRAANLRNAGRKQKPGGPLVDRPVGFPPAWLDVLAEISVAENLSIPEIVRRAVDGTYINPQPVSVGSSEDLEGAPLLDMPVACGAPLEAMQDATVYVLSRRVADEVGFNPATDFLVRARGESMEGRGILDEFVVSLSPLKIGAKPRLGRVALVAFTDEEGGVSGTLKTWNGEADGRPRLLDGQGEPFPIPEGIVKAEPIAVATGVIGEI